MGDVFPTSRVLAPANVKTRALLLCVTLSQSLSQEIDLQQVAAHPAKCHEAFVHANQSFMACPVSWFQLRGAIVYE